MLIRPICALLAATLLGATGCATIEEPLWYKPGGDYTTAEFNRDRDLCMKEKKLDHECMRAKGWVSVGRDLPTPTPTPPPPRRSY